jgi:hypothetical protein
VRQCTTPLQLLVRRSHSRTVLSRAADRNWSVLADMLTLTTWSVCPARRVALTPGGCQIGYTDHTGYYNLSFLQNNALKSAKP